MALPPVPEDVKEEVAATNYPPTTDVERKRLESIERTTMDVREFGETAFSVEEGRKKREPPTVTYKRTKDSTVYYNNNIKIGPKRDSELDANDRLIAVAIDSLATGESILANVAKLRDEGLSGTGEDALEAAKGAYVQKEVEDYNEHLEKIDLNQADEDVIDEVAAISTLQREALERVADTEALFVDAVAMPGTEEEVLRRTIVQMKIGRMSAKMIDDMGGMDWVRNIMGMFLPGKQLKDNIDVTGAPFGSEQAVVNFAESFHSLTAAEQSEILPYLEQELKDQLPEMRAAQFLGLLADPAGIEGLDDWNSAFAIWDSAEILFLASKLVGIGADSYRASKAYKTLAKIGDKEEASKGLATGVVDEAARAEDALQMDDVSVVNSASPFKTEALDPNSLDGLSAETVKRIKEYEVANNNLLDLYHNDKMFIREGVLLEREREIAEEALRTKFAARHGVDNVVVTSNEDSFLISYNKTDNGGRVQQVSETLPFKLDRDTQEMELADPGIIGRFWKSPLSFFTGDAKDLVRANERLDSAQARAFRLLNDFHSEAIKAVTGRGVKGLAKTFMPSTRRKLDELNSVLLAGDAEGVEYTASTLKHVGVNGVKLDEDQIEAYFKIRKLVDSLYMLRNSEVRKNLTLKGMKNVSLDVGENGLPKNFIGKPLINPTDARNSVVQTNSKFFYDAETGEIRRFSFVEVDGLETVDLVELYKQGKVLVKMDKHEKFGNHTNKVKYAVVDSDQVSELPMRVLHKLDGYIPKLNDEAAWFVKTRVKEVEEGQSISALENRNERTVRAFETKAEADAYAEQLILEARAAGQDQDSFMAVSVADRQIEQERMIGALDDPLAFSGGGLYTGPRATEEVLWGAEGIAQPRVNAFEAISRNLASVSRYITRNEFRLGMEERAVKTANYLLNRDRGTNTTLVKTFEDLARIDADTENGRKIKEMYKQINDWNAMPTSEERFFKGMVQGIIDSSIGPKLPGFAKKGLHSIKSTDPVGAARAAAFHGLLGWFNPVQMFVQAQGAAVSLSMNILNPSEMGRVFKRGFAIQALQNLERNPRNFKHVAKALGMDESEVKNLMELWDRSGLADAVLTTADHAAAAKGHGVAMSAVSRAADDGLWFYRAGELFNRRLAFSTAYGRWLDANKGKELTSSAIKSISTEANNLMLNLSKANKAAWQKGLLSLPTQFAQVNAKTVETMLGMNGNFSLEERGRILMGQLALYGGAGIPLGNLGTRWLMETFGVDSQEELEKRVSPETVKLVNEGIMGWATMAAFGVDVEIGERAALLGGVNRFLTDFMFSEGTTADKFLGAFGNTNSRFWDGVFGNYEPVSLGALEGTALEPLKVLGNPFLASISTFRNVDKAIFMHNFHAIVDKNFSPIVKKDFDLMEEIAVAIGFRNNDEISAYKLGEMNKISEEYRKSVSNEIAKLYHVYAMKTKDDGTMGEEEMDQFKTALAVLYLPLSSRDQLLVRRSVASKLTNNQSKLSKEWLEWHKNNQEKIVDQLFDMRKGMSPTMQLILGSGGVKRQGLYDEGEE